MWCYVKTKKEDNSLLHSLLAVPEITMKAMEEFKARLVVKNQECDCAFVNCTLRENSG